MEWDGDLAAFTYMCPCGDVFQITRGELAAGEEIAHCPSCTLVVKVVYDAEDYQPDAAHEPARPPRVRVPASVIH